MNFICLRGLVSFLLALSVASPSLAQEGSFSSRERVVDMVLLSIDGEPFTADDLQEYLTLRGEKFRPGYLEHSPETMRVLQDFVTEKLLEKEAKESGLAASEEEIATYIERIKIEGGVDQQQFEELLQERGLNIEKYRKQVSQDIVRARLLGTKVRSKINVLDEDIERYLEEHPALKPEKGTVRIKQIFVRYPEISFLHKEEDALCAEMKRRLTLGEDFEAVGGEFYQDLGYVRVDELKEDLQEAVSGLEAGETSEVFETPGGCRIVLFLGASEGTVNDEVREKIKNQLYEETFREKAQKYIEEDLRKKYHVEIKV